ncbi:AraC family transcriptional regulator [Actinoplanes sp. NBRC 103695]|nr:AraC family transcriptional regulator [Actinoplanes sp. NBRC 103695]
MHRVVAIVDELSNPFELGCVTEVFGIDRPELGGRVYDLVLCAPGGSAPMRQGFFTLGGVAGLAAADGADTLIVPNRVDVDLPRRPGVLAAIRRAHRRGARLIGLCTGAFTLAEAGVLDGRRAATHWQFAGEFRRRFPEVDLQPDVLFVDDGDVLTSAGSAAALDLGLHLVRRDHGAEVATAVARRLVFPAIRDGGQRQFVERPLPHVRDESLAPLLAWAQEHLAEPLTVAGLSARANVSPATLHRRFRAQLGATPLGWLTAERLAVACRLLERGERRMEVVARASGLGTGANLRQLMRREIGLSPSEYRRRFSAPAPASP